MATSTDRKPLVALSLTAALSIVSAVVLAIVFAILAPGTAHA